MFQFLINSAVDIFFIFGALIYLAIGGNRLSCLERFFALCTIAILAFVILRDLITIVMNADVLFFQGFM